MNGLSAYYIRQAEHAAECAKRARITGRKVRGYTAEQHDEMAHEMRRKAELSGLEAAAEVREAFNRIRKARKSRPRGGAPGQAPLLPLKED